MAENFCMDYVLLVCAKRLAKNQAKNLKLAFASALGAGFAVAFPLLNLKGFLSVALKVLSGCALVAIAGKFKSVKGYCKMLIFFLAVTFLCGGTLLAIFAFAGVDYAVGEGYLISSVPVGIPLFCALILSLCVKKIVKKFAKNYSQKTFNCHIYRGQLSVEVKGFYDSGNNVYCGGQPVCILPQDVAAKIVDVNSIKNCTKVHTVAGSKNIAIFTADKLVICDGQRVKEFYKIKLGISPNKIACAIIHPCFAEAC